MTTFTVTQDQKDQLVEWLLKHNSSCSLRVNDDGTLKDFPGGAAGGMLTYRFTDTNLGQVLQVYCACGEFVDLTDYDW